MWRTAAQVHVGQDERFFVGAPHEGDTRLVADRTVHAVGAHEVARPDPVTVGEGGCHVVTVLRHCGDCGRPDDLGAEFPETRQQERLGIGLRDHQCVGVRRGEFIERHSDQQVIAVAESEGGCVHAPRHQVLRHAVRLEQFQGVRVHDGCPRGVGTFGLTVDDGDVVTGLGQHDGGGEAHRSGAYHQDFCL